MTDESANITAEEKKRRQEYAEIQQRKELRHQKEQKKKFLMVVSLCVMFALLFASIFLHYTHRFFQSTKKQLADLTDIEVTVSQISQLVDNIRQMYIIHQDERVLAKEKLVEYGAVPAAMLQGGSIVNNFGGKVLIEASKPLENAKEFVMSPTFKISYQGLSKENCVALAMMDWGGKEQGLLAAAIGSVDYQGNDTAFTDIDKEAERQKPVKYRDKFGHMRYRKPHMHFSTNVARPDDKFVPVPFTQSQAELGCNCSGTNCSFALHYTVYNVDKPRHQENSLEIKKIMQNNLLKKVEQKKLHNKR